MFCCLPISAAEPGGGGINMVAGKGYISTSIKIAPNNLPAIDKRRQKAVKAGFDEILQGKIKDKIVEGKDLKFSKHAEIRLQSRNINLSVLQMDRIIQGVNRAGSKGVKDSLILMDDVAFVINIKNRTVITAANKNELRENVFTNIDGAVIV